MDDEDTVQLIDGERHSTNELTDVTNGRSSRHRERTETWEQDYDYEVIADPDPDESAPKQRSVSHREKRQQKGGGRPRKGSSTWSGLKPDGHQKQQNKQSLAPPDNTHLQVRLDAPRYSNYQVMSKEYQQSAAGDLQEQYEREGFRMVPTPDYGGCVGGVGSGGYQGDADVEVVIDGRFSSSFSSHDNGFVPIEAIAGNDHSTTRALDMCNKFVINPYNVFLKVIGWRKFHSKQADKQPLGKRACNVLYPTFIFLMLVFTCITQTISCFSRTRADGATNVSDQDSDSLELECRNGIFYKMVLPDILILVAYLIALYLFRWGNPEYLSALVQKVFLSYTTRYVAKNSQKRLVFTLLAYLVIGAGWVVLSTCLSILRFVCIYGTQRNVVVRWDKGTDPLREDTTLVFSIFAMLGFLFFDLLYVAVVINYCTQCQLAIYFTSSIKDKVQNKAYLLGDAVKEIYNTREIVKALNGQLAYVTSFILFVFLQNVLSSYIALIEMKHGDARNILLAFCNILQWSVASLVPIIQAVRLTSKFRSLKKLGLEIAARPFYYSDTPQLVLDSFLNYTNSTNYRAKLMFIPMYSELIVGGCFIVLLILSLDTTITRVKHAELFWL